MADVQKFVRFCNTELGKNVLKKEAEYIYRELKYCNKILDIGCGIGSFEQELSELDIRGVDCSNEMLIEARKRSNKPFVIGNAENLDFDSSSFDAVFCITALEFINDYEASIQEAYRVTKSNGRLLVMMLNPVSGYFKGQIQKENSYLKKVKHTNLREIKSYISRFYNILKEEYFLGIKDNQVFNTSDERLASLYVLVGKKGN